MSQFALRKVTDPMQAFLDEQLHALTTAWKPLLQAAPAAPEFDWEDWQEALLDLTGNQAEELLVRGALSAVVKSSGGMQGHEILQQLLAIGARAHGAAPQLVSKLSSSRDEEVAMR